MNRTTKAFPHNLNYVFLNLPSPPFTEDEKQRLARQVYEHIWQQCVAPQPVAA